MFIKEENLDEFFKNHVIGYNPERRERLTLEDEFTIRKSPEFTDQIEVAFEVMERLYKSNIRSFKTVYIYAITSNDDISYKCKLKGVIINSVDINYELIK